MMSQELLQSVTYMLNKQEYGQYKSFPAHLIEYIVIQVLQNQNPAGLRSGASSSIELGRVLSTRRVRGSVELLSFSTTISSEIFNRIQFQRIRIA
jgi:hypothetical protein